mgnify:CR=1 FL=1
MADIGGRHTPIGGLEAEDGVIAIRDVKGRGKLIEHVYQYCKLY